MGDFRLSANPKAWRGLLVFGATLVFGLMLHLNGLDTTKDDREGHQLEWRRLWRPGNQRGKIDNRGKAKNVKDATIRHNELNSDLIKSFGTVSFWHTEEVRQELKHRVSLAVENLHSVQKESQNWTRTSLPRIFTRAAMVYLPPDNAGQAEQYRRQFRAFFTSWIVMRTKQPTSFRTDLLVVTTRDKVTPLRAMGCETKGRKTDMDRDRCVIVVHVPMKVSWFHHIMKYQISNQVY